MHIFSFFRSLSRLMLATSLLLVGFYSSVASASGSGGTVYFHRPAGFNAAFLKPDVIIDGRKVGTIGSGECHRVRLPAGRHKIIIRDQASPLLRLGIELNATRVNVWNGADIFITVSAQQELDEFNERSPAYDMLISSKGRRC
ncbi:MAG: DUF2846 domain-containing protein [Hyphomicrobiaceae bacterium]|nr:DUF2846 domain-containing protein [Hyphomicrobiaceae bacterium]